MQDDDRISTRRRRVTAFRAVIALLLVGGCAFAIFRLSLRSKLNARIAAIRAAGHPVTWAELDKWYSIPEGADNAADEILNALSYCQQWEHQALEPLPFVGHAELPARIQPLAADTMSLMSEYLDDNREALERLHESVADMEYCRYPVDFSAGIEVEMSHILDLLRGARLLQLDAISQAERNETELAVRSVISTLKLGDSLANEPSLGSYYNQRTCRQLAALGLERVVSRIDLTDEQLTRLSEALIEAEQHTNVLPGLIGERCLVLAVSGMSTSQLRATGLFDGDRNESPLSINLHVAIFALGKFTGQIDRKAILCLDATEDCIESLKLPFERRRAVADAIEKRFGSTSRNDLLMSLARYLPRVIVEFDAFARLRTARVALAVERYRLAQDALPEVLTDLAPAYLESIPKDPFDGNELRYKKLDRGFVVYSIGKDLNDDGGIEKKPRTTGGQNPPNWDITFIVER